MILYTSLKNNTQLKIDISKTETYSRMCT